MASPASRAKLCWPFQDCCQAAQVMKEDSKRCHGMVDSLQAKTGNMTGFHTALALTLLKQHLHSLGTYLQASPSFSNSPPPL